MPKYWVKKEEDEEDEALGVVLEVDADVSDLIQAACMVIDLGCKASQIRVATTATGGSASHAKQQYLSNRETLGLERSTSCVFSLCLKPAPLPAAASIVELTSPHRGRVQQQQPQGRRSSSTAAAVGVTPGVSRGRQGSVVRSGPSVRSGSVVQRSTSVAARTSVTAAPFVRRSSVMSHGGSGGTFAVQPAAPRSSSTKRTVIDSSPPPQPRGASLRSSSPAAIKPKPAVPTQNSAHHSQPRPLSPWSRAERRPSVPLAPPAAVKKKAVTPASATSSSSSAFRRASSQSATGATSGGHYQQSPKLTREAAATACASSKKTTGATPHPKDPSHPEGVRQVQPPASKKTTTSSLHDRTKGSLRTLEPCGKFTAKWGIPSVCGTCACPRLSHGSNKGAPKNVGGRTAAAAPSLTKHRDPTAEVGEDIPALSSSLSGTGVSLVPSLALPNRGTEGKSPIKKPKVPHQQQEQEISKPLFEEEREGAALDSTVYEDTTGVVV